MKSNQINSVKPHGFYRWVLVCSMVLLGFKSNAQTSFYITDRVLGNSGSLDVVLASAVTSANAGNNVTVYFNVPPDVNGNAFCIVNQILPSTVLTGGSILFDKHPSATVTQGVQWDPLIAQTPLNFNITCAVSNASNYVKVKNIRIGAHYTLPVYSSSNKHYYHLKDEVNQSYAYIDITELAFKFEENYFDINGVLTYKIINLSTDTYIYGTVAKPSHTNWIKLNLGAAPGLALTTATMYLLEVVDVAGNKKFLKFKFQS